MLRLILKFQVKDMSILKLLQLVQQQRTILILKLQSVSAAANESFTDESYVDTKVASVSAAAKEYTNTQVAAISGATGSFVASGGQTVTVVNGLITSIV
jgi:hypothetical protein